MESNSKPPPALIKDTAPAAALTKALGQSEQVKTLVEECAEDLSSVNAVLKQELATEGPPSAVENAIVKSEAVEGKVQAASTKLSVVNRALKDEVGERHLLEQQLAAVTEQEQAARYAAFHDPLTGMANLALFNDRLEHGLAQAHRHGWNLAVMFLDLDKFKLINDTYGHDAGDIVLKTIAERLCENTREDDTVSRRGGDEFLFVLMQVQNESDIQAIAEKILKATQMPCDIQVRGRTLSPRVSASIGISIFPQHGSTADALLKNADAAMYQAKRNKSGHAFAQALNSGAATDEQ
jgi:diguanylate cyclase (GGDEF)-like protein